MQMEDEPLAVRLGENERPAPDPLGISELK